MTIGFSGFNSGNLSQSTSMSGSPSESELIDISSEPIPFAQGLLGQAPREENTLALISPARVPHPPRISNCFNWRACTDTIREVAQFRPGVGATLSGLGMMADMYDLSAMNVAMRLLGKIYGQQTPSQDAMMTSSVLVGSVVGQIGFGAYADKIGRRNLTLLASGLTLAGSLGSALAVPLNQQSPTSIYFTITAMRFILGLGIGGEYPLSASNTVEQTQIKDSNTALAYAMMILNSGCVVAGSVFTSLLELSPENDDLNWRLGLGFGAVLSAATLALRVGLLEESPLFIEQAAQQAATADLRSPAQEPTAHSRLLSLTPTSVANNFSLVDKVQNCLASPWLKPVAGAAMTWFLYDVSAFGIGLYSSEILAEKGDVMSAAKALLISNAIALPFSFLSMFTINDKLLGRQQSQIVGMAGMATMLGLMAMSKEYLWTNSSEGDGTDISFDTKQHHMIFTALYAAYNSFDALGPGTSTFAFSSEIFPTRLRGTLHGIAAATGKAGGVLGAMSFPYLKTSLGTQGSLLLMSAVCALGAIITKLMLPNYTNEHLQQLQDLGQTKTDPELVAMIYDDTVPVNEQERAV